MKGKLSVFKTLPFQALFSIQLIQDCLRNRQNGLCHPLVGFCEYCLLDWFGFLIVGFYFIYSMAS